MWAYLLLSTLEMSQNLTMPVAILNYFIASSQIIRNNFWPKNLDKNISKLVNSVSADLPCTVTGWDIRSTLQWRHNEHYGVPNHRRLHCLLNRFFSRRSKKTSKLRVTGLCKGSPSVTDGFPSQRVSNAENVSIWWRHHERWWTS